MLIVVSYPTVIENEAMLINSLFDEGMELFHLRKPNSTKEEIKDLLAKTKPNCRHKIALHQYHELVDEFKMRRLHFTEVKRKSISEEQLIKLKKMNYSLSTSIHTIKEYQNISLYFDYVFFGPLFNSISKQGYATSIARDFIFPTEDNHPKVIAIGGIEVGNMEQAMKMNFNGIAVLGTIWQQPEKSIQQFKVLKETWDQRGQ